MGDTTHFICTAGLVSVDHCAQETVLSELVITIVQRGVAFPLTLECEGNYRLCGHSQGKKKKAFLQRQMGYSTIMNVL